MGFSDQTEYVRTRRVRAPPINRNPRDDHSHTELSVESFLSAFFFFWIDLHCVRFPWRLACWTRCHRLARGQKP